MLRKLLRTAEEMRSSTLRFADVPSGAEQIALEGADPEPALKDAEIRARLERTVNSGRFNIVAIGTTYWNSQYENGEKLVGAVIHYLPESGSGNCLRLSHVFGKGAALKDLEFSVKRSIAWLRGAHRQIMGVDPAFDRGLMIAAIVYYND